MGQWFKIMGSSNISEDLPFDNSNIAEELLNNNYPILKG